MKTVPVTDGRIYRIVRRLEGDHRLDTYEDELIRSVKFELDGGRGITNTMMIHNLHVLDARYPPLSTKEDPDGEQA